MPIKRPSVSRIRALCCIPAATLHPLPWSYFPAWRAAEVRSHRKQAKEGDREEMRASLIAFNSTSRRLRSTKLMLGIYNVLFNIEMPLLTRILNLASWKGDL